MMADEKRDKLYDRNTDGNATVSVTKGGKTEVVSDVTSVEVIGGNRVIQRETPGFLGTGLFSDKETKVIPGDSEITIKKW